MRSRKTPATLAECQRIPDPPRLPALCYTLAKMDWRFLPWLGLLVLAFCMLLNAWIAEDAYISFRVIDNAIHGYGLRWNIYERVQVYTHPLWLLLQIPLTMLSGNIFLTSIVLSLACSIAALLVVIACTRKSPALMLGYFLIPLGLSKSFMDYTSSGLENALGYLLFALFGHVLLHWRTRRYFWVSLSLTVALALFNRLDTALLYAPVLAYLAMSHWRQVRWGQIVFGALPLLCWFAFALFYYGFIFPNTKYAKLGTDLDWSLYLAWGFNYLKHLLVFDMPGAMLLASSLAFIIFPTAHGRLPVYLALGVALYCAYIVCIGGDYMGGRFWALPIFVSVWMIYAFLPETSRLDIPFVIVAILITGLLIEKPLDGIRSHCRECLPLPRRILNSTHTFRDNKLVESRWPLRFRSEGRYRFAEDGKILADQLAGEDDVHPKRMFFIGMSGYYAGPKAQIVDELGLADALLSRLPARKHQRFFIGHFRRDIPRGYYYAIETGILDRMSPPLAIYYDKLRLITSGDLLDFERLKTIIRFNLGEYDQWRTQYLASQKP